MDDCRKCQTSTVTPAEPGDLTLEVGSGCSHIRSFYIPSIRAQSRTIAADPSSEERGNWSCREQEMYDEQRRPFAYVCYSRCGGSDPVVKSLDMNIHDHIANREHSPKTS